MREKLIVYLTITAMLLMIPAGAAARWEPKTKKDKKSFGNPQRVLVLNGNNVHNVGELHMHVGNWGIYGSWPGSGRPYSESPSAQWPAGSGVEYLFVGGLWVGALKNSVPAVTTAAYEDEFRPTQEPEDIIYRSAEGARGGNRLPSLDADDDRDGLVDEDWLNGHDDDLDGLIDEDYAAVSKQMFSCWYTDDQPISLRIFPEHNPLNIMVRQESYQWEEDRFDDFIGLEFKITNIGEENNILEDLYIGFFADCDAGPRDRETYWDDDATARVFVPVSCTDLGPVQIDIAYTYDGDGDEGKTLGYFGVMFLGHTTDPTGEVAPKRVGISTYANFSGSAPFENGGDPTNDFERYELLSQQVIERDQVIPRDYRMLISAGPFSELQPESTLTFQVAFVAGQGKKGLLANAANAQLTYNGAWFNLDGSKLTGVAGRETPVPGEAFNVQVDTCLGTITTVPIVPRGEVLYINNDCGLERQFQLRCGYSLQDSAKFMTGIDGNESQLNWIVGTAPPPPFMRIDDHSADGLVVYWDNFSEVVPDVKTQIFDFEGYRLWRADNWDRPLGSSAENGPAKELWKLLQEIDVVNNFGRDEGLAPYRYAPLGSMPAAEKQALVDYMKEVINEHPLDEPACPPGVSEADCDTVKALARWDLGVEDGRQYYRYVDRSMHLGRPYFYAVTAMDHDFDDKTKALREGKAGDPSSNFTFVEPKSTSQPAYAYQEDEIYVVPNPATTESMAAWTLAPNNDDPTGIKVEFRNLPRARGTIRIYTLAGDLVIEIPFDGSSGIGTVKWDLVSRNLQDVTSGVYIYAVESQDANFDRFISKFVVIR